MDNPLDFAANESKDSYDLSSAMQAKISIPGQYSGTGRDSLGLGKKFAVEDDISRSYSS